MRVVRDVSVRPVAYARRYAIVVIVENSRFAMSRSSCRVLCQKCFEVFNVSCDRTEKWNDSLVDNFTPRCRRRSMMDITNTLEYVGK